MAPRGEGGEDENQGANRYVANCFVEGGTPRYAPTATGVLLVQPDLLIPQPVLNYGCSTSIVEIAALLKT